MASVWQPDALVLESGVVSGAAARLTIRDGAVAAVGAADRGAGRVERIAGTLLPGLIDLQCNGARGRSVDEITPEALDAVAAGVWDGGAVAFVPTLITAPFEALLERLAAVARWIEARGGGGARPLGIHLEGPFLETPGTHDAAHFVDPTPERVDALLRAAGGHLALVTLAPGREGAAAAVARLRAAGVAVALGHGTARGLEACVQSGASLVTHLFNAMDPLHHREPGLAGLALDDERLSCSLIPDGAHVHAAMLRNAYRCLGPKRTILITDSVAAAGMPDGEYRLAGAAVRRRGGEVRDAGGRLAGSALTMAEAAQRWLRLVDRDLGALAQVASANPARLLGAEAFGAIAPGRIAAFGWLRPDGGICAFAP